MAYDWKDFGLHIPQIMLPDIKCDYEKFAVVACDQYTSQPEYWEQVTHMVGGAPSALSLMLPECYLGSADEEQRIRQIHSNMERYMADGTLTELPPGCILVKRTAEGRSRLGLVISVDLESYDYHKGSQSLIRATEGTVEDRIPPRLRIRRGAPLEMPHILILIDDPEKTVIEPLEKLSTKMVYDTELMMSGGHVTGHFILEDQLDEMKKALSNLMDAAVAKYGKGHVIFQAMGDGNHSLATAKAGWEEIKRTLSEDEKQTHPARYALCEIENIHDEGIVFEPIHRVAFGNGSYRGARLLAHIVEILAKQNGSASLMDRVTDVDGHTFVIPCIAEGKEQYIVIKDPSAKLEAGVLQRALDELTKTDHIEIDYIHGDHTVRELANHDGNVGLFLPAMDKYMLFPAVAADGALPRKTFSMGEANEKRYYIETKSLKRK